MEHVTKRLEIEESRWRKEALKCDTLEKLLDDEKHRYQELKKEYDDRNESDNTSNETIHVLETKVRTILLLTTTYYY